MSVDNSVLLCGSSLVYDCHLKEINAYQDFNSEKEFLDEEVAQRLVRLFEYENGDLEMNFATTPRIIAEVYGEITPLNLTHPYNWFHFLIDSLPSFLDCLLKGKINRDTIVVSGVLNINMTRALKVIFNDRLNMLQIDLMKGVKSKKTIVTKNSFQCKELQNGDINQNFKFNKHNIINLRNIFDAKLNFQNTTTRSLKLFIIRLSDQRNVVNIRELIAIAESMNYRILQPERHSFDDQVTLFSNSTKIVGSSGAWLANLLFVNKDCEVSVLYPITAKMENSIWGGLGKLLDVPVTDYYFEDIVRNERQPVHSDFTVDINKFKLILM